MAKFNVKLRARRRPVTAEGAPAFTREPRTELFLLGVSNMVGEATFYEGATDRDARFRNLVATVAVADPDWFARFVPWLRTGAMMRSASVVAALEGARAQVAAGVPGSRSVVDAALQRADEPGEALAYWLAHHGRTLPKPVKRGIADAAVRLYTERSLLKYDSVGSPVRFGDVIDLTHPTARDERQGDLFRHALDRRHRRDNPLPASLGMLAARQALMEMPVEQRREVTEASAVIATPLRSIDLLRRLTRVRAANAALRAYAPWATPARRFSWLRDVVAPAPRLWPAALVYLGFTLAAALAGRRPGAARQWARDESSRARTSEAAR